MCGPIVCAVLGPNSHFKKLDLWLYNLGRLTAYALVGLLLGSISKVIGSTIAWIVGILLILIAILPWEIPTPTLTGKFGPARFVSMLNRCPPRIRSLGLGGMTSLLPCMTLTPAYALAAGSGHPSTGALFMVAFGLGTLPIMLLAPTLSQTTVSKLPKNFGKIVARVFLLLAGSITIWRASI
jgi:hypothetical protein